METFYENVVDKNLDEFLSEVERLNFNDKLDLVVLMTARMREKHIITVKGSEFWDKTTEEQMGFIAEIKSMHEKRDTLLAHIKEVAIK